MFANRPMTDAERADLGAAIDEIMEGANGRTARIATFLKLAPKPGVWVQVSSDEPSRWRVMVDGQQAGLFETLESAQAAAMQQHNARVAGQ